MLTREMDNDENIRRKFAEWVEWLVDQQDPNNFLIIPEFGVMPKSVDWEGFAVPLVHPAVQDRNSAQLLRLALTAARLDAMTNFKTLAELKQLADEALKMPAPSLSDRHHDANNYITIETSIRHAANERRTYEQRFKSAVTALAMMSGFRTIDNFRLPKKLAKSRASNGGKKSAASRVKKPIDKNDVISAAGELGWPTKTYNVTKILARRFKCSTSYIGRVLAAARPKSA